MSRASRDGWRGRPRRRFPAAGAINRCPHLAGNRLLATLKPLKESYTAEFWFWNGLPNDVRPVTGYLFGRGGESLALGGTNRRARHAWCSARWRAGR